MTSNSVVEKVALAMRAELERQMVPMSEPSDSDPIKHMAIIYHSPAVSLDHLAQAAIAAMEDGWRKISEFEKREGKALIFDPRWGVAEGLKFDSGKWGLATFNGQIIEAHPTKWKPLSPPPPEIEHD